MPLCVKGEREQINFGSRRPGYYCQQGDLGPSINRLAETIN